MPRGPILGAREAPPGTSPPFTRMNTAPRKHILKISISIVLNEHNSFNPHSHDGRLLAIIETVPHMPIVTKKIVLKTDSDLKDYHY
jgi:hypothetical protein